jgi:hypothetical protein
MSTLIVVRGAKSGVADPTYGCIAHDMTSGQYALVEVKNGRVANRTLVPASERHTVEAKMQNYRGTVQVDDRTNSGLLPLSAPSHAQSADLIKMCRAKSDTEIAALRRLATLTRHQLQDDSISTSSFRGAAQKENHKSSFERTQYRGFTVYRGGMQDELGRCSDLTRVEPHTKEWEDRLNRAYRGFDAVRKLLQPGVAVSAINRAFLKEMDSQKDVVFGDVVRHIGQQSHEDHIPCKTLQKHDFLGVGAAIGDGDEVALVYQSAHAVGDAAYGSTDPPFDKAFGDTVNKIVDKIKEIKTKVKTGEESKAELSEQLRKIETKLNTARFEGSLCKDTVKELKGELEKTKSELEKTKDIAFEKVGEVDQVLAEMLGR